MCNWVRIPEAHRSQAGKQRLRKTLKKIGTGPGAYRRPCLYKDYFHWDLKGKQEVQRLGRNIPGSDGVVVAPAALAARYLTNCLIPGIHRTAF